MKRRLLYGSAALLLALSVLLVVWQGSFNLGQFGPSNPGQTLIFWAISSLIFVLMVTLGWILLRTGVKLYIERQSNREGSRIRTKLVVGALTLSIVPVFFLVLFSVDVLSRNMMAWFTRPADQQLRLFVDVASMLKKEMRDETSAQAALLAALPETRQVLAGGPRTDGFLERFCREQELVAAAIFPSGGGPPLDAWGPYSAPPREDSVRVDYPLPASGGGPAGSLTLVAQVPLDVARRAAEIKMESDQQRQIYDNRKWVRNDYLMLMALITLFVLFVATWIALFLAKQISVPITALLRSRQRGAQGQPGAPRRGARGGRTGDAGARLQPDDPGTGGQQPRARPPPPLHRGHPGEHPHGRDFDRRGRLHPAREPRAGQDLPGAASRRRHAPGGPVLARGHRRDQVPDEARAPHRRGLAASSSCARASRKLQLAVTVSALEEKLTSGFVVVLEDTSELLRAQKAAAWHEVARRVAHEIKNPLTPIALSAERIGRQIERLRPAAGQRRAS